MNNNINSLVSQLMNLKYEDNNYSGGTSQYNVISKKNEGIIRNAVAEWYDTYFGEYARKIGEFEAKVYVYEHIIANSNFAPMLQPPPVNIDFPEVKASEFKF